MSSWRDEYLDRPRDTTRVGKDREGLARRPHHRSRSPPRREHRRRSRSRSPERRRRSRSRSRSPRRKSLDKHQESSYDRWETRRRDAGKDSSGGYRSRSVSTSSYSHSEETRRHRSDLKHSSTSKRHRDKSSEKRQKHSSRHRDDYRERGVKDNRRDRRSTITGKKIKMKAPRDGMEEARADLLKFLNSTH